MNAAAAWRAFVADLHLHQQITEAEQTRLNELMTVLAAQSFNGGFDCGLRRHPTVTALAA